MPPNKNLLWSFSYFNLQEMYRFFISLCSCHPCMPRWRVCPPSHLSNRLRALTQHFSTWPHGGLGTTSLKVIPLWLLSSLVAPRPWPMALVTPTLIELELHLATAVPWKQHIISSLMRYAIVFDGIIGPTYDLSCIFIHNKVFYTFAHSCL
jgi:hypothetical protein